MTHPKNTPESESGTLEQKKRGLVLNFTTLFLVKS